MRMVSRQVERECGKPVDHDRLCQVQRLDAALAAVTERRWKDWVLLRQVLTSRACGCPRGYVDSLSRCSFNGVVDAEIDEVERVLVWTCPRCFTDHFDET